MSEYVQAKYGWSKQHITYVEMFESNTQSLNRNLQGQRYQETSCGIQQLSVYKEMVKTVILKELP